MASLIGVISIVCLLVSVILLLNLIQKAFSMEGWQGLIWGFLCILYPVGTYFYCRRDWEERRQTFMIISGLLIVGLILWLIIHYFVQ